MKTFNLLLTASLAAARIQISRQAGVSNLNISSSDASSIVTSDASNFNLANFNLEGPSLDSLELNGLNLGSVDLGNRDVLAEAILAMFEEFCLSNTLNLDKILSFGLDNDVELFVQLAHLMQLEHLGFLDLGGIQSLVNNGLVLSGLNLGTLSLP